MNLHKKLKQDFFVLEAILIALLSVILIFGSVSYGLLANEGEFSTTTPETFEETEEVGEVEQVSQEETEKNATTTETQIDTGDADALGVAENTVNTNDISTQEDGTASSSPDNTQENAEKNDTASSTEQTVQSASSTPQILGGSEATSTQQILPQENKSTATSTSATSTESVKSNTDIEKEKDDPNTSVENNNNADIENDITVVAETGNNSVDGMGQIQTGDAYAEARLVNLANLNLVNSTGFFEFLNSFFGAGALDIDLRNHAFFSKNNVNTDGPCQTGECDGGDLDIENNNNATINNNVEVYAGTGSNLVGNGTIQTGNAYASANVINVANTNIVDSNYLFLVFNSLGDWAGDLVFPSQDLFSSVFSGTQAVNNGGGGVSTAITNDNNATSTNNVSVNAQTGNNTTENGSIDTGTAASTGGVSNIINTNITNNQPFFTMIRLNGDWSGTVYGLPSGMSWERSGDMVYVYSDDLIGSTNSSSANGVPKNTNILNNNNADIQNTVSVTADTGGNQSGNGTIQTGNAYASANVINVANTNIIGRNVMFSIFNIFGNWSGDISFGRPDLFIGGYAEIKNSNPQLNHQVIYHFKVLNNGDLESTNTQIEISWPEELRIEYSNFGYGSVGPETKIWNIGDIQPGESREVFITTAIDKLDYGENDVTLEAEVKSNETDNNVEDNTEFLTFKAYREKFEVGGEGPVYTAPPWLRVEKFASATSTTASSTIDYKIIVTNKGGGSAYDAALVDTLKDENGNTIHEEVWEFGEIFAYEEITIEYSVIFNKETKEGVYTNSAKVYALGGHPEFMYGYYADSKTAQTDVFVQALPQDSASEEPELVENKEEKEDAQVLPTLPLFEEGNIKREIKEISKEEVSARDEVLRGLPYHGLPIAKFTQSEDMKGDFPEQSAFVALSQNNTKQSSQEDKSKAPAYAAAVFIGILGALRGNKDSKWMLL